MPSTIETTTAQALETALISRILSIVPSHTSHRSSGWVLSGENEPAGSGGMTPRLFYVEITPGSFVPAGMTGNGDNAVAIGFDVVADYGAFTPRELGTVLEMDQWDLYDDLNNAINVIPGLLHCELAGEPDPEGDEDSKRFRFPLTLHYLRARR